jgi:hypothetical protein
MSSDYNEIVIAGIPTKADGVTCHIRDVRRVMEDNPANFRPDGTSTCPAIGTPDYGA